MRKKQKNAQISIWKVNISICYSEEKISGLHYFMKIYGQIVSCDNLHIKTKRLRLFIEEAGIAGNCLITNHFEVKNPFAGQISNLLPLYITGSSPWYFDTKVNVFLKK